MEKWLPENEFLREVLAGVLVLGIASAADWVFGFIVWKSILRVAEYVGSRLGMKVAIPLWLLSILVLWPSGRMENLSLSQSSFPNGSFGVGQLFPRTAFRGEPAISIRRKVMLS
jgi:hypothetical protein